MKYFAIFKWAITGLFFVYLQLLKHFYMIKTVDVSRLRTWIVRIESKNADHLTPTTAFLVCSL